MSSGKNLSRRGFLRAAGTCLGVGAFPQIVTPGVLGLGAAVAPGEKIVMGVIGSGGRGRAVSGHFVKSPDCQIVAVCDPKSDQRAEAKRLVDDYYGNKDCAEFNDFRELLARPDIDAVLIASNDHWHVLHAIAAAKAGKHVYMEKPVGMSIEEVQVLRRTIHDTGVQFQFGTQQRSEGRFREVCERVLNGQIGKLKTIKVGVTCGIADRPWLKEIVPQPVPEGLDFDLWMGPAPERPYVPERVKQPHWFHISDHSLGFIAGWGIHHVDIAQWGNGTELTGPVEVEGTAVFPTKEQDVLCDNNLQSDIRYRYANGVEMSFTGSDEGMPGNRHGVTFEGDAGKIWVNREGAESEPASILQEALPENGIRLNPSTNHQQNLLDCIRSGEKTCAPIDVAACSDIVCQIGWVAVHVGKKLQWDPEKERFSDDDANKLLKKEYRDPWKL